MTGVGTQFTTTFRVGDAITVFVGSGWETQTITAITDATDLVTTSFTGTASGAPYTFIGSRFTVAGNGNTQITGHTALGNSALVDDCGLVNTVTGGTTCGALSAPLNIEETVTAFPDSSLSTLGVTSGIGNTVDFNPSAPLSAYQTLSGINNFVMTDSASTENIPALSGTNNIVLNESYGNTISQIVGTNDGITNANIGYVNNLTGYQEVIQNSGGGEIANAIGVLITTPANTSGIIDNNYGLYIDDQSGSGASYDNYNIYSAGSGANYFGGNVIAGSLQLSNVTGTTQCLTADSSGNIAGTGSPCGSGGGSTLTVGTTPVSGGTIGNIFYHASGNLLGEMTTTGSGTVVALATSPVFTTSATSPIIYGGSSAGSSLSLVSTSGTGSNDAVYIKGGTSGGTTIASFFGAGTYAGKVGIATTTPSYPLSVYAANTPQLSLSSGAGLAQWTFANEGGNLYFATTTVAGNATSSPVAGLTILNNGNIGISNTSPAYKLDVTGIGHFTGLVDAAYFVATSSTATSTFGGFIDVNGTGANATSTFASNLWVKGTLRTGTGSMYLNDGGQFFF